jgi:hypothetical protein
MIRNANVATVYYSTKVHDHNDTLTINEKWKSTLESAADLEVQVMLHLDHDGNTATKKVSFKVQ